jgi:AraC-like DNA-binding protein
MSFQFTTWSAPFSGTGVEPFGTWNEIKPRTGDVVLIRCEAEIAEGSEPALTEVVRSCRQRFPGSPAVVWIPSGEPDRVIALVRAATSSHVRAILGGETVRPEQLRNQLTSPEGISSFVLRWAADVGYLPTGPLHEELNTLLNAAPNVRTLERLARERQVAARTCRGKLQQMGLPTPRAWLGLAHALHVAFFLQRNSTQSLQTLAEKLGIPKVSLMSQQFHRVFGISPGQVRGLLGAEPLLQRWFQSQRRSVN